MPHQLETLVYKTQSNISSHLFFFLQRNQKYIENIHSFNKWHQGNWMSPCKRRNGDPYLLLSARIGSKGIKELSIRFERTRWKHRKNTDTGKDSLFTLWFQIATSFTKPTWFIQLIHREQVPTSRRFSILWLYFPWICYYGCMGFLINHLLNFCSSLRCELPFDLLEDTPPVSPSILPWPLPEAAAALPCCAIFLQISTRLRFWKRRISLLS